MHRVKVDRTAAVPVVVAGGELDAYAESDLVAAFAELTEQSRLVVDLGAVSFLDSTALGAVVRSLREVAERGGESRIVLPRTSARRIFELTMLDSALPVAASREQALVSLNPAG